MDAAQIFASEMAGFQVRELRSRPGMTAERGVR
jgi:hypothetical protein